MAGIFEKTTTVLCEGCGNKITISTNPATYDMFDFTVGIYNDGKPFAIANFDCPECGWSNFFERE